LLFLSRGLLLELLGKKAGCPYALLCAREG
jgi:hypothetical protein